MSKKKMNVHELTKLIEAKKIVPEDDATPYLMKSEVLLPEESPDGKLQYNMLLSSSKLVQEYFEDGVNQLLSVDHTYGVTIEEIPVLILGRLTSAGHYCPIAFVFGNRETTSNAAFLFSWIKEVATVLPTHIVADGARAYGAGLREVFEEGEITRLMCK